MPEHLSSYKLWLNLGGGDAPPRWRDLRPDQLAPFMPFVMVVDDRDVPGDYRVRLAGSLVDAVLGGSLIGRSVTSLGDENWAVFLTAGIENATANGRPALATRPLIETATRSQRLTTLFLPFSQEADGRHVILAINTIEEGRPAL